MRYRHLAFTLLLCAATPLDAGQPLRMTVTPMKCFEPADLQVRVWIEPHADNRTLDIVADSPEFYRRSVIDLEGGRAPRAFVLRLRHLPGGEYVVAATLADPSGRERASVERHVSIIPGLER